MEHSVLCGSENYRVKDPFNILDKVSIHTYLNAVTYSDVIAPAVRKDAPELLNWLNNEIQTLGKDGRLKQAYEKTLLPVYGDTVSESDIVVEYK